ncbi:Hint domain-containing protein [Acetobacter sp. DmW_136]|uniref:Hint domain-containing protein n=1 Tax=Acetobacter sp. DmW_136 TaxID=2591091 RepID=UPI001EE35E0C|nr:Hint domain-containing protein [Acetobacter sp. DmW_136]
MSNYPLPSSTTQTISSGQTVSGASYGTPDHVVVEGNLTSASLTQTEGRGAGIGSILVQSDGTLSHITVTDGGNIFALSGGRASDISLDGDRSADLIVENGGSVDTVTASNSAGIDLRGGTLSNVTLTASASMSVESGGAVSGVNVGDTAQVAVDPNSQISSITVSGGGTVENQGGTITSATIQSGGNVSVERGYSYNPVTSSGGYSNGTIDQATISSGGTLTVGNGGSATNVGLKTGGLIDFSTLTYDSSAKYSYDAATYTLTVTGGGGTASVTLDPDTSDVVPGQQFDLVRDDDGSLAIETCFLAGSMIQTPNGDVPVENIRLGDEITTYVNGKEESRSVIWAGKAHATVRPELADDEAGYPVRILKDAIADGVPYKDMLITSEHCLFFKGRFVPVRMLVNGVSIFYDKSITSYDYYHVETEQHSVIQADGMLTESYLDTGNRRSFRQEGSVVTLGGKVRTWENDAGAPLCVDRAFVEPLFRALEWRENSIIGCQIAPNLIEMTNEPDLHLVTQTGAVIRPMRKTAHKYSFMLPPETHSVRIISRASRPSDVIGPFVDDRRYMGVAVADVQLQCAKQQFDITSHLQDEKPSGWHDTDWTDCAWTNGNAELSLGNHLTHGKMGILSMTIRAAGPYLLETKQNADMKTQSV